MHLINLKNCELWGPLTNIIYSSFVKEQVHSSYREWTFLVLILCRNYHELLFFP